MTNLGAQKEKNVQLMTILKENGVLEGEMRVLDFFFYTKIKRSAYELRDSLKSAFGYESEIGKRGWLRPTWSIIGTARVNATLADLNAFCEKMWECAEPLGCEFDGWGTEL